MWNKSKVVMLPTNEKANKGDIIGNDKGLTKTYTKEDFMNAIHKVELLENRNYSKLWKKIEEYL